MLSTNYTDRGKSRSNLQLGSERIRDIFTPDFNSMGGINDDWRPPQVQESKSSALRDIRDATSRQESDINTVYDQYKSTLLPSNKQNEALKNVICSLLTDNKVSADDLPLWLQNQLLTHNNQGKHEENSHKDDAFGASLLRKDDDLRCNLLDSLSPKKVDNLRLCPIGNEVARLANPRTEGPRHSVLMSLPSKDGYKQISGNLQSQSTLKGTMDAPKKADDLRCNSLDPKDPKRVVDSLLLADSFQGAKRIEFDPQALIVRDKSLEYYICHRCGVYKTHYKKDMQNHFKRYHKCPSNIPYSASENVEHFSTTKIYRFTFPIEKLTLSDYIFIVKNYPQSYNVINADYRKESAVNNAAIQESLVVYKRDHKAYTKESSSLSSTSSLLIEDQPFETYENMEDHKKVDDSLLLCARSSDRANRVERHLLITTNQNQVKKKSPAKRDDEYDKTYYDEKSGRYVCNMCNITYANKQTLKNHQRTQKKCQMIQQDQRILEVSKQVALKVQNKRVAEATIMNTYITNNTLNNNNNITNNQNNTQNLKVEVRDFIKDRYDVSHINKKYCEDNKDFFIYDKFLDMVMMNDHNHNIFFTDDRKHAIVYTGKEFVLMKSDKAGYFVLGKLKDCIGEVVCVQKEEIKIQKPQIERYYHLVESQYLQDTTLRRYNVDTHQFYGDSMCINFRNRDEKLHGIIGKVSKHGSSIRDTLDADNIDVANMPVYDPPIPDYQSARNRNRDLKDKD